MNIQLAKENVLKNLTAELEKMANNPSARKAGRKTTYFFNIGQFVKNAMDAIERQARLARNREIVKAIEKELEQNKCGNRDSCCLSALLKITKLL